MAVLTILISFTKI